MLALADTGTTLTVMPGALLHRLGAQRLRRVSAVLAEVGFAVTGYDTNDDFVTRVNATGDAGFRDEGLDELLATSAPRGASCCRRSGATPSGSA